MAVSIHVVALAAFAFASGCGASKARGAKTFSGSRWYIPPIIVFCVVGNIICLGNLTLRVPRNDPALIEGPLNSSSAGDIEPIQPVGNAGAENATTEVRQYTFPTVDERFRYYMGDYWYNRSDWKPDSCPPVIKNGGDALALQNKGGIITLKVLRECFKSKKEGKITSAYCEDSFNTLRRARRSGGQPRMALFHYGDSYRSDPLPFISKTRPGSLAPTSGIAPPIIWPLKTSRHFKGVEKYHKEYVKTGKEVRWEDKLPAVVWRGVTTGDRVRELWRLLQYDPAVVDVAFTDIRGGGWRGVFADYIKANSIREKMSIGEMTRYKYLLSVEGNDVATGLKWMLYSNSVVMMPPPTMVTWAMEDLLLPFVHYIPLATDLSNVLEMIAWAEQHQQACQDISSRATEFIERLWMSEQARKDNDLLREKLATAYVNQFHEPLSKCKEEEDGEASK